MKYEDYFYQIRRQVSELRQRAADSNRDAKRVLDIAPDEWVGAELLWPKGVVETLGLPGSGYTHEWDLCKPRLPVRLFQQFDVVLCTEVLEHVEEPWFAVVTLYNLLRRNGMLYITTPFQCPIHPPYPDRWRFSEDGLRCLLDRARFVDVQVLTCPDPNHPNMPFHYSTIARKADE